MLNAPASFHRRSIRLKGHDYAQPGAYFVTIVAYHRMLIFGEIVTGKISLNNYGTVVHQQWIYLQNRFKYADFPVYVIMPNHIHGIVHIRRGAGENRE
jgi:putative transposase